MALDVIGFGLHAFALHPGALAVVQPLLVSNVLFALPDQPLVRREAISGAEVRWAVLLVTRPGRLSARCHGRRSLGQRARRPRARARCRVLLGAAAITLVVTARRPRGSTAAPLLGIATGVLFAVTASLLKVCTGLLRRGLLHLLGSRQLYVLVPAGGAGLLLTQLAYRTEPLAASLSAITVVHPLVAILLGVVVFDQHLRHSTSAVVAQALFLSLLAVTAVLLGRLEQPAPA